MIRSIFVIILAWGGMPLAASGEENLVRGEVVSFTGVSVKNGGLRATDSGSGWKFRTTPRGVLIQFVGGEQSGAWGGWYLNYDPVRAEDPLVEATWQRVNDREDPETAARRRNRTPLDQARWDNHVRYIIPLGPQLEFLRSAGFEGIDVYWKQLENVIYGGRRPAAGAS